MSEGESNCLQSVLDAQSNFVLLLQDALQVVRANRPFLDFFELQTLEQFFEKHHSFFGVLEDVLREDFVPVSKMEEEQLLEYLLENQSKMCKVAIHKEDRLYSFAVYAKPVDLQSANYMISLHDISELERHRDGLEKRVLAESEKGRFREKIMHEQSRRSSMGELLVNIAHQWRQPLNNIGILVQDIEEMYELEELSEQSLGEQVEKIMKQLQGLSAVISKFTGFYSKKDILVGFFVRESIEKAVMLVGYGYGAHSLEVKIEVDKALMLYNNPQAFEEVMIALLLNAREAIERKRVACGVVVVSARMLSEKATLEIVVQDNGGGIDEDAIQRIFDPYFTTKFQSMGAGLGLFMSRGAIEQRMCGNISVKNGPQGAEFTLRIPSLDH